MRGIHKKFDKELYREFDEPAKQAMKVHLELSGHDVTVPPENYGADLFSHLDGVKMYHEVEVSRGWRTGTFPYFCGSIPERKIRLKQLHVNEPLYFWMLRADLLRAMVYSSFYLNDKYLIEVPNRIHQEGEYFFRIPYEYGKEFDLLCT